MDNPSISPSCSVYCDQAIVQNLVDRRRMHESFAEKRLMGNPGASRQSIHRAVAHIRQVPEELTSTQTRHWLAEPAGLSPA